MRTIKKNYKKLVFSEHLIFCRGFFVFKFKDNPNEKRLTIH